MDPTWIPSIGPVGGCAVAVVIVALVLHFRREEIRMRVETEMRQMDLAYQRALESLRR
jgi:hypothetical protein